MEHSEATETMASARYLLGEMNDEERDSFEEHFFACGECARDIRDGSAMIDSIRAGRTATKPQRSTPIPWLLAAAASVALVVLGFQNNALRRDASPKVMRSYSLLTMGTRGASPTVIENPSEPIALFIDIPPQPPASQYRIEIRDSAGRAAVSLPVSADEARDTVTVYVPSRRLQSGSYTVVITGGSSTLSSAPLTVR